MSNVPMTPQQQAAINYEGSMVITACPGSGKTTVMQEKIRKITTNLLKYKGVIAITFTKKASQELKLRCKYNAHDTKQSFFGTIDSFCLKEIILPFISRVWGGTPSECRIIKRLQTPYLSFLNKEYISPTVEDILSDSGFKKLYDSNILWMKSFSALAVFILNESLSSQRYICAKYSHIFIDEYQDSSKSQHQLFHKLHSLGLVATAVGDTSQSIYEFRGGDQGLLTELVNNSDKFEHFKIDINHRSHASIINYASRLIDPNSSLLPCENKTIFRRVFDGNLTNSGNIISNWISAWIRDNTWGVTKASDIAILAPKDASLRLLAMGLHVDYRIYTNNPLDDIGNDCSELYSYLLAFKYGYISTIQEIIDNQLGLIILKGKDLVLVRSLIRSLRDSDDAEVIIKKLHYLISIFDIDGAVEADEAVRSIMQQKNIIKQFMPLNENEIQIMTLHKSKGLEFKVVFHIDLEEWSLPFQKIENNDWDNPIYPTLSQDTNLHYVGITRAKNCCILVRVSQRQNSKGGFSNSKPSYFFKLQQLEGLYA